MTRATENATIIGIPTNAGPLWAADVHCADEPATMRVLMNAIRNFLYGFGSIIAIQPPRGRNPLIEAPRRTTDRQAIAGDWKRVGDDLRRVLRSEQTRHRGQ